MIVARVPRGVRRERFMDTVAIGLGESEIAGPRDWYPVAIAPGTDSNDLCRENNAGSRFAKR